MILSTTRFGAVRLESDDIFLFSNGLIGIEECRRWVLLEDTTNDAVGWLQSATHPDIALAVVSPRRFVADYKVRIPAAQLASLELDDMDRAFILNVVAKNESGLTVNLKAPLLINLDRRIGRQVVTSDEQPLQHALSFEPVQLRKSA
jgi:flagellar assembly factor FliW